MNIKMQILFLEVKLCIIILIKCFVGHYTTKLIVDSIQLSESEDEDLKLKWDLHCALGEDKMNPVNNFDADLPINLVSHMTSYIKINIVTIIIIIATGDPWKFI